MRRKLTVVCGMEMGMAAVEGIDFGEAEVPEGVQGALEEVKSAFWDAGKVRKPGNPNEVAVRERCDDDPMVLIRGQLLDAADDLDPPAFANFVRMICADETAAKFHERVKKFGEELLVKMARLRERRIAKYHPAADEATSAVCDKRPNNIVMAQEWRDARHEQLAVLNVDHELALREYEKVKERDRILAYRQMRKNWRKARKEAGRRRAAMLAAKQSVKPIEKPKKRGKMLYMPRQVGNRFDFAVVRV